MERKKIKHATALIIPASVRNKGVCFDKAYHDFVIYAEFMFSLPISNIFMFCRYQRNFYKKGIFSVTTSGKSGQNRNIKAF